jgi:hypothetical protein
MDKGPSEQPMPMMPRLQFNLPLVSENSHKWQPFSQQLPPGIPMLPSSFFPEGAMSNPSVTRGMRESDSLKSSDPGHLGAQLDWYYTLWWRGASMHGQMGLFSRRPGHQKGIESSRAQLLSVPQPVSMP